LFYPGEAEKAQANKNFTLTSPKAPLRASAATEREFTVSPGRMQAKVASACHRSH